MLADQLHRKSRQDRLTIRMPDHPGIDRMNNLKAEWAIWLTQFVLRQTSLE
ncbi:MAG: hypothetical protein R3C26_24465 [Calditrichia bacterium]